MTDLTTALHNDKELGTFEGKSVRRASLIVRGLEGGLRKTTKIEPRVFAQGDRVQVVLDLVAHSIRHDPVDAEDLGGDQERVHIFDVEVVSFVDSDEVRKQLAQQKDRIQRAEEESKGVARLPTDLELMSQHELGKHDDAPAEGCAACTAAADGGPVPFDALSDEKKKLWLDHGNGKHASGPVEDCPSCDKPTLREPTDIATAKKAGRATKAAAKRGPKPIGG